MAIRIEFYNNIVSVADVEERYPGGYETFKKDFPLCIGTWYDGNLIRFGSMAYIGGELGDNFDDFIIAAGFPPEELPEGWHLDGTLMWTNKMPEEPLLMENGEYFQGGFTFKTYDIWKKVNFQLAERENPKPFRYFEYKNLISRGWYQ